MDQKLPEENIKGRENSWYSTVAKFLLKTGQGDQRLSWNIFFFFVHTLALLRLPIKFILNQREELAPS